MSWYVAFCLFIIYIFIIHAIIIFINTGFGVYYLDKENRIKLINFDIVSSDLSSEAYAVVRGFRILRQQQFFKAIEKPNYIVWFDAGKHFRNC